MKHRNKLLLVTAVICGVLAIAVSAWLTVAAVHMHSQSKQVRGIGEERAREELSEEEPLEKELPEEETKDSTDSGGTKEDQTMYGVMEGNCYSNEWFRFKVELPENYLVLSGDEFDYAQEIGADQYMTEEGQDKLDAAKNSGIVRYVMMAYEESGSMSVNIGIERLLSKNMTMEQYLNIAKQNLQSDMSEELSLTLEGITEEVIGAETYYCLHEKLSYGSDGETCMDQYVRMEDGYVMVMSVGYAADMSAQKDEFLSMIQSYQ